MNYFLAFSFLSLFGAVYLLAEVASAGARQRVLALKRATTYAMPRASGLPQRARFHERVLLPAANRLARLTLKLSPHATHEMVRTKLVAAGLGRRVTPTTFLACKAGLGLGFGFVGLIVGGALAGAAAIFFAAAFGALGFIAPGLVVSRKARGRREEVRAQLPDALDLLAVSVEAGLGFDGAVDKLTDHMEGAIAEEFAFTLGEMRIGESRHEALKKLAQRVDTPEVSAFARAIIQADQLGISLGRILKVQAADTRNRRQMAAEEKAMKAPIKMLFPTVLFIFPAMFIVVLGPAFLAILDKF